MAASGFAAEQDVLKDSYKIVRQEAKTIKILQEKLAFDGFSSKDFYARIVEPLDRGQSWSEDYLKSWSAAVVKFHNFRYQAMKNKQRFFMVETHRHLRKEVAKILADDKLPKETKEKIEKQFSKLNEISVRWMGFSATLGSDEEAKARRDRLYSFDDYFALARKIMKDLKSLPKPKVQNSVSTLTMFKAGVQAAFSVEYMLLQILIRNVSYLFPSPFDYLPGSSWLLKNSTPINSSYASSGLFNALADMRGFQLEVQGREHLKNLKLDGSDDGMEVNLFLPSHRNGMVDAMLIAKLGIKHFLIFSNAQVVCPNSTLGNLLASLPEYISVGKVKGYPPLPSTEKLLLALKDRRSPNVFNYSEGFVAGVGANTASSKTFDDSLLIKLIEKGYRVNVIPISMEADSEFLLDSAAIDRKAIARIHSPLSHEVVNMLVAKQKTDGVRYLSQLLSTIWYENTTLHAELDIEKLFGRAEEGLGIKYEMRSKL